MPTVPRYDSLQVPVRPQQGALRVPDAKPMRGGAGAGVQSGAAAPASAEFVAAPRGSARGLTVPTLAPALSQMPQVGAVQPTAGQPVRVADPGAPISALGDVLSRASSAALDIMAYRSAQADQARVADALNQAKEAELRLTYDPKQGFMAARGTAALQRESGKPLADEYRDTLSDTIKKLREGLGNDRQREMFDKHAPAIVTSLYGRAMAHEADQSDKYYLSVQEGGIRTAQQEIGLRYNELDSIDQSVERIRGFVANVAAKTGKSAQWVEAETANQSSAAIRIAAEQALEERQPGTASAILARYAKAMQPDDLLAVRTKLEREQSILTGMGAAQTIWDRSQPRTRFDALHSALIGQESGGRQFGKDGAVLTSKDGALGVGQFMPDTARATAEAHGIPFDLDRLKTDHAYNLHLSRLHFGDLLREFGGDEAKALAAYNAGAGSAKSGRGVRGAEAKAAAAGRPDDWLSFMPAETRNYVPSIMAKAERMNTRGQRPTLADLDQQAREHPDLTGNPDALQRAQQELEQRAVRDAQAAKQRETEGYAAALDALRANGGNWNTLPPSIRDAVPADKVDEAMRFAANWRKGQPVDTDMALYGGLVADPAKLAVMTDAEFAALGSKIAEPDLKHLAALRAKAINPDQPESKDPGNLNTSAIKGTLENRLTLLGVDPNPKDKDEDGQRRYGAIRQYVDRSLIEAQRAAGRKFNDDETAQHIDKLMAQNATIKGWFSESSVPMLTMQPGDIPSEDRKALEASFQKNGVSSPTDAQILGAYWQLRGAK